MKLCLCSGLLTAVLGCLILFSLKEKNEALAVEVKKVEATFERQSGKPRRSNARVLNLEYVLRKNEEFEGGYPERWDHLYNLPLGELKKAASWILSTQVEPYEGLLELPGHSAVLDLVKELDPEWVLEELEKREAGENYPWHSRALAPNAFAVFLRKDRGRALRWYEDGYGERTFEFFSADVLSCLAVGEYLKSDPARAIEIYEEGVGQVPMRINFPSHARLENRQQLAACAELLRKCDHPQTRYEFQKFVARETYRLSGVAGMREFLGSVETRGRTDSKEFEILGSIVEHFESEDELRGLLELANDAPPEIREKSVAWVLGGWAYYDAPLAESVIRELPHGEAR